MTAVGVQHTEVSNVGAIFDSCFGSKYLVTAIMVGVMTVMLYYNVGAQHTEVPDLGDTF